MAVKKPQKYIRVTTSKNLKIDSIHKVLTYGGHYKYKVTSKKPTGIGNEHIYRMSLVENKTKKIIRKKNPVPPSRLERVRRAIKLFMRFRGDEPKYVDEYKVDFPDVAMEIGMCDGIMYTTIRDGKKEHYIHEFTGKSRPILAASWDGTQVILLGGNYSFTSEGIKDRCYR